MINQSESRDHDVMHAVSLLVMVLEGRMGMWSEIDICICLADAPLTTYVTPGRRNCGNERIHFPVLPIYSYKLRQQNPLRNAIQSRPETGPTACVGPAVKSGTLFSMRMHFLRRRYPCRYRRGSRNDRLNAR
jgi:hypothetical protein